jgi:spermidine/putrescine transport system ATP-binding protein
MLMELDAIHDTVGITFIYVTHDQQEALSVSDRIAVMNAGDILQVGSPQQIYENPSSDFVARFIGETNMFTGTVSARNGQILTVATEEFGSIYVEEDRPLPEGSRISVTVRPEKIRISPDAPQLRGGDMNILHGTVAEPIYSGFQTKYLVGVGSPSPIAVFRQHATWSEGVPDIEWKDEVYLSFSAHDAVVVEN